MPTHPGRSPVVMTDESRRLFEAFAHSHDPALFASDAVYTQMPGSQSFNGRDEIGQMLRLFYHDAFSGAEGARRNVAMDSSRRGRNTKWALNSSMSLLSAQRFTRAARILGRT